MRFCGDLHSMRILIIDDDHDLADLAKAVLSADGFAVDVFNTLEDGRLAIETTDYNAIILDLNLPDGEGISLLEERRKAGDTTPVLILSTRVKVEDRVKGLESGGLFESKRHTENLSMHGVDTMVEKSPRLNDLINAVAEFI